MADYVSMGVQAIGPKVQVSGECLMLRWNPCPFCMPPKELKGALVGDGRHEKKGEKGLVRGGRYT